MPPVAGSLLVPGPEDLAVEAVIGSQLLQKGFRFVIDKTKGVVKQIYHNGRELTGDALKAAIDEINAIAGKLKGGKRATAKNTTKWTPGPTFQRPALDKGDFLGALGNSPFAISDEMAGAMGVPHGSVVPWREGIPDLSNYSVPGPNGIPSTFSVPGLKGDKGDRALMLRHMATTTGMSQPAIKEWLTTNKVRLHHAGGDAVQIVPLRIHALLHHSGGALQLRGGN
jgi:hypothetical protein